MPRKEPIRPTEGELSPEDSLTPVAVRLGQLLHVPVRLIQNWVDGGFDVKPGEIVLLENCRVNKGEKKNNDEQLILRKYRQTNAVR